MNSLKLFFDAHREPELIETRFVHSLIDEEKRSVRGRSGGAYLSYGSFAWTAGVKALAELFLRAVIRSEHNREPLLIGGNGSAALSLDYAINKEPIWLAEMFGTDRTGNLVVKRLIRRSNSDRKRRGPVALSLNPAVITRENIEIYIDRELISSKSTLQILLSSFHPPYIEISTSESGNNLISECAA